MIVDGITDKEKLIWRGRKGASRRKRAMRETKKSIKEIGGRRRLKEKAVDNCDFQLEGIQQLSLKTCISAGDIDQTISMFSVLLKDPYVYFKL